MKRKKRIGIILLVSALLAGSLILAGAAIYVEPYTQETMDMSLLSIPQVNRPSELYVYDPADRAARNGDLHPAPNASLVATQQRIYTPYDEIPQALVQAFISIEDKRFWQHDGVDFLRTGRAGINYLFGHATFGGSTITQQLVKNLTGNDAHSLERKLTELFRAMDLERQTDKQTILEVYLNIINLAEGCYGVGAAAQRYYSKPVAELTLPECATIAAITNNPARYNPLTHPDQNRTRRNLILCEMAEQGYITDEERDLAMAADLGLQPAEPPDMAPVTSWYTDMVVSDVIRDLQINRHYSYAAASMLVYQGGLTIETAMDESLQRVFETYYAELDHFPTGEQGKPQSAGILIDPYTGDILAVAGAIGEKTANRIQNYATDTRRPAGSCIKPLTVYAPAIAEGLITWGSIYEDEPITQKNGQPWPSNADGLYRGRVSVGQGITDSLNPVSVRILEQLGLEKAFSFAYDRLGVQSLIRPDANLPHDLTVSSLALGQQSRGVTVRELTAAYSVFIDGIWVAPRSYHRVLDQDGNVLLENRPAVAGERVLSEEQAALMTQLLAEVTEKGTASRSITVTDALGIETAGKTGTTQKNCDRWFIGYTPRLLAGIWMGYDYPMELKGIQGNPCVTIWDDLMKLCEPLYCGSPAKNSFPIPTNLVELEFCSLSGCRPNPYCTDPTYGHSTERGWFIRGTEPQDLCTLHTEPPIRIVPMNPQDPERIPLLPNDMVPDVPSLPPTSSPEVPRRPRWFSFFERSRKRFYRSPS